MLQDGRQNYNPISHPTRGKNIMDDENNDNENNNLINL